MVVQILVISMILSMLIREESALIFAFHTYTSRIVILSVSLLQWSNLDTIENGNSKRNDKEDSSED